MRIKVFCGVCLVGLALVAAPVAAQLRAEVSEDRIVVDGVTAGGKVAVLGVVDSFPGIAKHVAAPFLIGQDDDGDGRASIDAEEPSGARGVFVTVDIASGKVTSGVIGGRMPEIEATHGPGGVFHGGSALGRVGIDLRLANVMLVRPGVGAWRVLAGDGGKSDADGVADGTITLVPESFTDSDDVSAGPGEFEAGDLVVAIDMSSRAIFTMTLGAREGGVQSQGVGGEQ